LLLPLSRSEISESVAKAMKALLARMTEALRSWKGPPWMTPARIDFRGGSSKLLHQLIRLVHPLKRNSCTREPCSARRSKSGVFL